jgi:hypothetical protein
VSESEGNPQWAKEAEKRRKDEKAQQSDEEWLMGKIMMRTKSYLNDKGGKKVHSKEEVMVL